MNKVLYKNEHGMEAVVFLLYIDGDTATISLDNVRQSVVPLKTIHTLPKKWWGKIFK